MAEAHRRRDPSPESAGEERERARQRARDWRQVPGNKERHAATQKARREADPERWRAEKQASSARYADKNRDRIKARRDAVRTALRVAVIEAYGGRCSCPGCHVHHAELLTVDHVNGDGHHRQRAGSRSSRDFYRWLQKNDYPSDYQLLCGSCNLAKSDKERCPLAGQEH
jgi:hypothetical protein